MFNSAGEKVRVIYNGNAEAANDPVVTSLPNTGPGPVNLNIGGIVLPNGGGLTWQGANDDGQWVGNGIYYLQETSTDSFGNLKTVTVPISVISTASQASLEVYNSAGELVKTIPVNNLAGLPTDLTLQSTTFAVSTDPATGQASGGLSMNLKLSNTSTQPVLWDGTSNQGAPVSSGTYIIKLTYSQAGQLMVVKTVSVTLLQGPDLSTKSALAGAVVAPNPFNASSGQQLQLFYTVPVQGYGAVRVYDLAGELVSQAQDPDKTGRIILKAGPAGGVYLLELEIRQGAAVLGKRVLKVAVLR